MTNMQRGAGQYFNSSRSPGTLGIIAANVAAFFIGAFSAKLLSYFVFAPAFWLTRPWTLVTWSLVTHDPISLLFSALWAMWCCSSLERSWGTKQFLGFYFAVNIITALTVWVGASLLNAHFLLLSGLWAGLAAPTIAWCTINRRESISFFGIVPVSAPLLAAITLVLLWYSVGPPVLGLFALSGCAAAWWYASRGRYAFQGYAPVQKHKPKLRLHDVELEPMGPKGLAPMQRYKAWQERRKLKALLKRSFTKNDPEERSNKR